MNSKLLCVSISGYILWGHYIVCIDVTAQLGGPTKTSFIHFLFFNILLHICSRGGVGSAARPSWARPRALLCLKVPPPSFLCLSSFCYKVPLFHPEDSINHLLTCSNCLNHDSCIFSWIGVTSNFITCDLIFSWISNDLIGDLPYKSYLSHYINEHSLFPKVWH